MEEDFRITININNKQYVLYIERTPAKEALMRNAGAVINKQVALYRARYAKEEITDKDLLAMVALQLSKENLELKAITETKTFAERVGNAVQRIDDFLEQFE